uniref:PH domain-containing protein n=1 Tax=Loa loa TaxID=7209 RepID=A0A1I7VDG3_LOALO
MEKESAPGESSHSLSSSSSPMTTSTKHINLETESIGPSKAFNTSNPGIAHFPIDQASQLAAPPVHASETLALDVHSGESTSQLYASYFAASATVQQKQQQQQQQKQQQSLPGIEKEKQRNTESKPRIATKSMFGSLSRLASDAFKGAKQATEQLAQVAQHTSSTSNLTTIIEPKSLQTVPSSYPLSPSPSFPENELLPGLSNLSEEERQKIMAVMASAELDMASTSVSPTPVKISILHTLDSFFKNEDRRDSISSLSEQSKVDSVSIGEVESKSSVVMPLSFVSSDIVGEVDLSYLSSAERSQIISVMKAAEFEESNIIPPVSSLFPVSNTPLLTMPINEGVHDNLAGLSPTERAKIVSVTKETKDAQEGHFEATHAISSQPVSQTETSGDYIEENGWREDKKSGDIGDQDMAKHEILTNFVESSATSSTSVTLPQIDSDYTITENSSCDSDFRHPSIVSSIVTGTDIQETDIPSAPGSSDYGSADFDYTYGDDRRFIFDGASQLEDSLKENQDADSGIGTLDWSDQGHYEWAERKPRMWTTVFTEEEEKGNADMQKHEKTAGDYMEVADSHHQIIAVTDGSEETVMETSDTTEKNLYQVNMTQDSDEKFLISADNHPKKALESQTSTAQNEVLKTAVIMRIPPAITVTDHDDGIGIAVDDDSDAETSPSSDEDDYPDQVIEVPSAPPISYDVVEKEQEQQEALGKAVLQQIQAFGEAANDEFDVQWVHDNLIRNEAMSNIFAHDESTTPAAAYDGILLSIETERTDKAVSLNKVTPERKNPFLDIDDNESTLKIVEDSLESDDVDYTTAASYYNNQSFLTHRPGSVYTIPEDKEQDDGQINTDSKFYAKEVVRRVRAESASLKATSKSTAPIETTDALNMVSALSSAQKSRDVTRTVYSGDYYNQLQKRQDEVSKQMFRRTEADTVTPATEANVNSYEASRQLEHTTMSSSIAQKDPTSFFPSGSVPLCSSAMVFGVSSYRIASAGFDGIQNERIDEIEISTNLPPNRVAQHSESETSSNSVCITSNFHHTLGQPFNSPSKAKPASLSGTLGSGLDLNVATISSRSDNDSTATRLKRSPAMMLMGDQQHHVSSTSTTSEPLTTAYMPTLLSQTILKEVV